MLEVTAGGIPDSVAEFRLAVVNVAHPTSAGESVLVVSSGKSSLDDARIRGGLSGLLLKVVGLEVWPTTTHR